MEYVKVEIERSRLKEEANNEKYLDMLKNMFEVECEVVFVCVVELVVCDYVF